MSSRQLYQLPKKQIDRIERRLNYDRMKVVESAAAVETALNTTSIAVNAYATVIECPPTPATQQQKPAVAKPQQKQQQQPQKQQPQKQSIIPTHSPADVAALPLLEPFQIKKPSESTIVNTIINEQHAADTLATMLKNEAKMRSDYQKVKSETGDANNDSNDKKSNASNSNNNANSKKSSKNSKKSKKSISAATSARLKDIESQIDTMSLTVHQCRTNLYQFAGWTKAMLQAEYSKIAVTLDPDSDRYARLEVAFAFLCPRMDYNAAHGNGGTEEYYHEQRIAYVKEMIPVVKKAGERASPASLLALPYVQKFQCDDAASPVVASLIEEMHQLVITEGVRVRLEKQIGDPAKLKVLKHAEEMLQRREVLTSDLVRKHYRKKSIKLHPDRVGEHMRPIFEEFTDARNVLSDIQLRQSYLRGMLGVVNIYGTMISDANNARATAMISDSHDAWNRKHRPDVAEDERRGGNVDGGGGGRPGKGDGKPLKLEGGLHQQVPRGVVLHHRRDGKKNHIVSVSIHVLRPIHEFYARVRSVKVVMRDTTDEKHVVEMGREKIVECIKFDDRGPILDNEIPVTEMSLNPGHWEVFWCATFDTVGTDPLNPHNATTDQSVTTRNSAIATFQVVDYDRVRKYADFDLAESSCKVIRGELSNTLHKLRTNQLDSASMINSPDRFGQYHQIVVRARKKCSNLQRLMLLTGKSSTVHSSLSAVLAESRQVFADLEKKADAVKKRKERKDDTKRFKAFVASVLESDDPLSWMREVNEAKLYREGGDVNRLYQLFFEGKGKYVLLVDSEMYKEASLRDDMFSLKQCKDLTARGEEVAIQEAKEEREAATAEEKRKKEEEEFERLRKEAEMRDKWAMVGNNANIHGLTSEKGKAMNNQTARIMYYVADKDRFEVQLYNSEEKAYLKKENLTVYYGHVPKPKNHHKQQHQQQKPQASDAKSRGAWACDKCTFENDDASTVCSMCTHPRSISVKKKQTTTTETNVKNKELDVKSDSAKTTASLPSEKKKKNDKVDESATLKKTIYVRSTLTKKLTGKRGRKKKDLVNKSGASDIEITTSTIGNHTPVHLTGSSLAIAKAIALIQETIGIENVSEETVKPTTPPKPPAQSKPVAKSLHVTESPPVAEAHVVPASAPLVTSPVAPLPVTPLPVSPLPVVPSPEVPSPVAPSPIEKKRTVTPPQNSTNFINSGLFSGFEKPIDTLANGAHLLSLSEAETQPTSQYSFGDAFLPHGLMDMSMPMSTMAVPPELPSEIGINSQGMTRESITEASVSSLNDRSNVSKTNSTFTLNENDPLLVFLRVQQNCIKGSVDEFYIWLVKSEDIESMAALKEAVTDEDYLNDSLKVGNGSSGLKGFKRKAFQRAVLEYEVTQTQQETSNDSNSYQMNGNAFLPSNLFSSNDEPASSPVMNNWNDPPSELVCPIGLVLMTVDPVLAADGVTYERASIENWFQKNISNIKMAQENLKWNPHSESDKRVIENGVRSPAYGTMMKDLSLTPNTSVRNMARAFKERKDARF